jgi:hypothetical protein
MILHHSENCRDGLNTETGFIFLFFLSQFGTYFISWTILIYIYIYIFISGSAVSRQVDW